MTETAELRIEQRMVGDVSRDVSRTRRELQRFDRTQQDSLRRGYALSRRLESGYNTLFTTMSRGGSAIRSLFGAMTSLQGLIVGNQLVQLGKQTYIDKLIGSNTKLEQTTTTFNTMVGDAEKAGRLIQSIREDAARTPFQSDDMLEASKRLLRLTGDSTDFNRELLEMVKVMNAINPEKAMADAAEALLDAEQGEFERLKEFGIKLKKSDVESMKKTGESLGQAALRGVNDALTKQTGGRDVVGALSETVGGRMSTLKDNFSEFFRELGEPAFEAFGEGITAVKKRFDELKLDPQFQKDFKEAQTVIADLTRGAFELATRLPEGINRLRELIAEARKFWDEHGQIITTGAGVFAANQLSNGALGRGAVRGTSRMLFGSGGGGGGAAGMLPGVQQVYVVNMPGGATGPFGGAVAGARSTGRGAQSFTTGGAFRSAASATRTGGVGAGAQALFAGGGGAAALGGAAIFGAGALGAATILDVWKRTQAVVEGFEEQLVDYTEVHKKNMQRDSRIDRQRRERLGGTSTQLIGEALGQGRGGAAARMTAEILARTPEAERQKKLEQINANLLNRNVRAQVGEGGQLSFAPQLTAEQQQQLQRSKELSAMLKEDPSLREDPKFKAFIDQQEKNSQELVRNVELMREALRSLNSAGNLTIVVDGARGTQAADDAEAAIRGRAARLEDMMMKLQTSEETE